jgi:hypothetical protein
LPQPQGHRSSILIISHAVCSQDKVVQPALLEVETTTAGRGVGIPIRPSSGGACIGLLGTVHDSLWQLSGRYLSKIQT